MEGDLYAFSRYWLFSPLVNFKTTLHEFYMEKLTTTIYGYMSMLNLLNMIKHPHYVSLAQHSLSTDAFGNEIVYS